MIRVTKTIVVQARAFLLSAVILSAVSALGVAQVVNSLNKKIEPISKGNVTTVQEHPHEELLNSVSIFETDDRIEASEKTLNKLHAIGLSKKIVLTIAAKMGAIGCSGYKAGKSAEVYLSRGTGSLLLGTNQQVFTDSHIFFPKKYDYIDLRKADSVARNVRCTYQQLSLEGTGEKYEILFDGSEVFGSIAPNKTSPIHPDDFASVKLDRPVRGQTPFVLASRFPSVGEKLYMVSAIETKKWNEKDKFKRKFSGTRPIFRQCTVIGRGRFGDRESIETDCDVWSAASGGLLFGIVGGEPQVYAVHVASPASEESDGYQASYAFGYRSIALSINDRIRKAVSSLGLRPAN